jgi:glutamine amidotransferase
MCRLFALRANQATRVEASLLSAPHALGKQSCCDRRGVCHDSGWGVGHYSQEHPFRTRSIRSAGTDAAYRQLGATIAAPTVLAHVRLASTGSIAEKNSHPFLHSRWMFAHNGTLFGFAARSEPLIRLIPAPLRACIEGETDSEHAFYYLLGRLERVFGSLDNSPSAEVVGRVLSEAIGTLAELYPGQGEELSQFNFLITDGLIMVASRWRHSLFWLERRGLVPAEGDHPVENGSAYHALAIASEPTTSEGWSELPERTMLQIESDLGHCLRPI